MRWAGWVVAVLLAAAAVPGGGGAGAAADRFVVRFAAGLSVAQQRAALASVGLVEIDRLPGTTFVLTVGDAEDAATAASRPGTFEDVRPPQRVLAFEGPNDPFFEAQWHLTAIGTTEAWERTRGAGAIVAVLDTGVDRMLSDLAGTTFVDGIDIVNGDTTPEDDNGHGSHVIGTIAQTTDNRLGVAGVAPEAAIMPVKILDDAGAGDGWQVAEGIHWAVDRGADVINLSLGTPRGSPLLEEAVLYAASRGVTVVAATGNDDADEVAYPAAYPSVIAVGAVRYDDRIAPYSNRGTDIDVVAPGGDTSVDQNDDGYGDGVLQQTILPSGPDPDCFCFFQGTSMASPHVAGVAALLVADGVDDPERITSAITGSARDLGAPGRDDTYGHGLVQAAVALELAQTLSEDAVPAPPATSEPDPSPPEPPEVGPMPGRARDFSDVCPDDAVTAATYRDVPDDNAHARAIDCLAWLGVVQGTAPGTYSPQRPISRAQMATFIIRALETIGTDLPSRPPDAFTDDEGDIHEEAIDRLAALGIVAGTTDRVYGPDLPVTRAQMATFLARTVEHVTGRPIDAELDQFDDDDGDIHEQRIDAVATVGAAAGTGLREFRPSQTVRRDQMASFIARTLDYLHDNGHPPT